MLHHLESDGPAGVLLKGLIDRTHPPGGNHALDVKAPDPLGHSCARTGLDRFRGLSGRGWRSVAVVRGLVLGRFDQPIVRVG